MDGISIAVRMEALHNESLAFMVAGLSFFFLIFFLMLQLRDY
jgi:hypothetical protein